MKIVLLVATAVLAAPAVFAQAINTEDPTFIVAPGVTDTPTNSPVSQRPIRGAVVAEEQGIVPVIARSGSSDTATMGAAPALGNRYWFNVPKNVEKRDDFRRWRGLL